MKRLCLTTVLCFSIICLTCNWSITNAYQNKSIQKKKSNSPIISFAHTIFLKDQNDDEISIYFSTLETLQEDREKVAEIVLHLYKEFVDMGYKEIPSDHPVPPNNTISIDVIQQANGIAVVVRRGKYETWKLFETDTKAKEVVDDIMIKLSEVEV